jgi:hypothetical protein
MLSNGAHRSIEEENFSDNLELSKAGFYFEEMKSRPQMRVVLQSLLVEVRYHFGFYLSLSIGTVERFG